MKKASILALMLLLVLPGLLTPLHDIKAASCVLQGNTITVDCEFAPDTYYYNGTLTIDPLVTVTAGSQSSPGIVTIYADDIVVNGTISADGMGSAGGAGSCPGASGASGGGGCHAGFGGRGSGNIAGGSAGYGFAEIPSNVGSGGGDDTGVGGVQGGRGGGAIWLGTYSATGTLSFGTLGAVTANGENGVSNEAGGGSGGAIYLDVGIIDVQDGIIQANGGNGAGSGANGGGGGGGGMVAVRYTSTTGTFTQSRQAFGGNRGTTTSLAAQVGAPGTVYTKDIDDAIEVLTVQNDKADPPYTRTDMVNSVNTFNLLGGARFLIDDQLEVDDTFTYTSLGKDSAELWIRNGFFQTPDEAMTFSGLNIHQSGTITGLRYMTFDNGVYSVEPSSALFGGNPGNRLSSLVLSGTGTTTFSATGTGTFYVDTFQAKSNSYVTHATNTATHLHSLNISATSSLTVDSGATVNVSGRGYSSSNGPGQGGDGGCGGGGSHGGRGGQAFACGSTPAGGSTYGSATSPATIGSAGGNGFNGCGGTCGGEGGGAIRIEAPTVTIDGSVNANGVQDSGGGAGGSVWIDAGTFAGSGTVTADGGGGDTDTGGGGGRIALYYATDSSSITPTAFGGTSSSGSNEDGGAGTIFIDDKDDAQTNGDLKVINNNPNLGTTTTQVSGTSETYDDITIANGTEYVIPSTSTLALASGGTLTGGGTVQPTLTVQAGGTFDPGAATFTFDDIDVTLSGAMPTVTNLTVANASFTQSGAGTFSATVTSLTLTSATFTDASSDDGLNLSSVSMSSSTYNSNTSNPGLHFTDFTVPSGSTFNDNSSAYYSMGENLDDLIVEGTFSRGSLNRLFLNTLTVNSGGTATHAFNGATQAFVLDVSATTSVTVNVGGAINVSGRGYSSSNGPGQGGDGGCGGGGSHGGRGGQAFGCSSTPAGGSTYGSATSPATIGSAGGNGFNGCGGTCGGEGGGAIRLNAPTVTVDGSVNANGVQDSGGGAGGAIWIDAGTFAGSGTVTADGGGGDTDTGGGGGRIALYYATDSSSITPTAYGGTSSSSLNEDGGAGTVFIDDTDDALANGDLKVINNNPNLGSATTQVSGTSETYDNITITNGTEYVIPASSTLTLASGGALTTGGTVRPTLTVQAGGTFDPGAATFTFSALDVTDIGTISTATNLTVNGATFTLSGAGAFGATLSTLTLVNATFTNGSSNAGLNLSAISMTGSTYNNNTTNPGLAFTSFTVPSGSTFNDNSSAYYSMGSGLTSLAVSGTYVRGSLNRLFVDTLTVNSGGFLSHATNTTSALYKLDVSATTSVTVNAGGTINVVGRGFTSSTGSGQGNDGGCGAGAGYGGNGGDTNTCSGTPLGGGTYGSVTQPTDLGSGGGNGFNGCGGTCGGPGGGAVKIVVGGTLTVDGSVSAVGGVGSGSDGGGSGGSIWLDVGTFAGAGTVSADGGSSGAGGGGGRIALYFNTDSSSITPSAKGGARSASPREYGGAGTVFIDDTNDALPNGTLIIGNGNQTEDNTTTQAAGSTQTYDVIDIRESAEYVVPSATTLALASGGSVTGSGSVKGTLTINSGGTFNGGAATTSATGLNITNNGSFATTTDFTFGNGTYLNNGTFTAGLVSLTIGFGANWRQQTSAQLFSGSDLTIQNGGTFTQEHTNTIEVDTVTIESGGTLTHCDNSTTKTCEVDFLSTTFTIEAGGVVDVDGKGFDPTTGTGQGGDAAAGGGAGYGGAGGHGIVSSVSQNNGGAAYGSATGPVDMGSGGGDDTGVGSQQGGSGGGVIRLDVTGTLTVNGAISADGTSFSANEGGGGSGGSVWLTVSALSATATITADGGNGGGNTTTGGGCGGGGRVAIGYVSYAQSATTTAANGSGCTTGVRVAQTGSVYLYQTGSPPVNGSIAINPTNPEIGQNVVFSATATDDDGVAKIEIYLDGTAPGNLVETCLFSPVETPASCQHVSGSLTAGSHSVTVVSYDAFDATDSDTLNFSVAGRTEGNSVDLSRTKVNATATVALTFTLSATSTGTLTLTFPSAFTVASAPTSGSSCLSGFGFTSTTMTATKTNCAGTVTMTGGTVVNPSVAGAYTVTWTNDNGSAQVYIVDDDQFNISASVDPVLTFNVGSQAAASACDGSFAAFGGTVALGTLTTSAVGSSDVSSVPHICTRLSTNAPGGAVVTVRSQNASLASTSVPGDTIPSSSTTLVAGTAGYGLCGGSGGSDTGLDSTTPVGAAPVRSNPFNGSCSASGHAVGALTTSPQTVWSVSDPTQNAFVRIFIKAAISSGTPPHTDYTDVLTFIATATY